MLILASTTTVNFAGDWSKIQSDLNSALGPSLVTFLGVVGAVLIVLSVAKYFWDRRRGGGGNHQHVLFTVLIGVILAAPSVVMPGILTIIDGVVNLFVKILP